MMVGFRGADERSLTNRGNINFAPFALSPIQGARRISILASKHLIEKA